MVYFQGPFVTRIFTTNSFSFFNAELYLDNKHQPHLRDSGAFYPLHDYVFFTLDGTYRFNDTIRKMELIRLTPAEIQIAIRAQIRPMIQQNSNNVNLVTQKVNKQSRSSLNHSAPVKQPLPPIAVQPSSTSVSSAPRPIAKAAVTQSANMHSLQQGKQVSKMNTGVYSEQQVIELISNAKEKPSPSKLPSSSMSASSDYKVQRAQSSFLQKMITIEEARRQVEKEKFPARFSRGVFNTMRRHLNKTGNLTQEYVNRRIQTARLRLENNYKG